MSIVDIPMDDIDYDSLLGELASVETLSNNTTSPTTGNDSDSGISDTPPMATALDNTTLDLNNLGVWPFNMDSPFSDDPNDEFNLMWDEKNPLILDGDLTSSEHSTIEQILAGFEFAQQKNQEALQQTPSLSPSSAATVPQADYHHSFPSPPPCGIVTPHATSPPLFAQRPVLPKPLGTPPPIQTHFHLQQQQQQQQQITNCVKLHSYAGTASTGPKYIKIEPITQANSTASPANITIITTSNPITVTKVPVLKAPLMTTAPAPITMVKTEPDLTANANFRRVSTVLSGGNTDGQPSTTYFSTASEIHTMTSPPAKRRRSESSSRQQQMSGASSPGSESTPITTVTLDQLKVQYGNASEEALKKHLRMIKNRESASLSRKRRKQLMENLEGKVKELSDENDRLKNDNSKLLNRVQTLEMENNLLKTYKVGNNPGLRPRKPLILMGVVLLVVFNVFTIKSLSPVSNDLPGSMALYNGGSPYNGEATAVRGRTILSAVSTNNDNPRLTADDSDYGAGGGNNNDSPLIPTYPYLQCVAFINKTHSQRINRDLESWVQEHNRKLQDDAKAQPIIMLDPVPNSIPSNTNVPTVMETIEHQPASTPRKLALRNRRPTKIEPTKGQLQPYQAFDRHYDDFLQAIDRKNDTVYFVSFKRDHLILPATVQNTTQRPKMSLVLPASITNLNKSIHVPANHVPMIQIDCEVEDTKVVFVKRGHIPSFYRQDLFQYYSSVPQTTV